MFTKVLNKNKQKNQNFLFPIVLSNIYSVLTGTDKSLKDTTSIKKRKYPHS